MDGTIGGMKEIQREGLSPDAQNAAEATWLKENIAAFWSTAYAGYCEGGRGAIIIDTTAEGLGEDTPFAYARQVHIEPQADETSRQVARLVSRYEPESQFVAVFIRPGSDTHYEFSMFQIGISETLLQAVEARNGLHSSESSIPVTPETSELETPDLDTLIAWENEGGCEAACPHACWVEPDGRCSHGHQSWLLELGLI